MNESPLRPIALVRKAVIGLIGGLILLAGLVMLLTPGPGILAILVGLGILSTEFASAKRALTRVRNKVSRRQADDPD